MTEWMTLVKHEMKKGLSLKDAMKEAKKHYHPTKKGGALVRVGGKRRHTKKQRGGTLYGFGEGGGSLHGGIGRMTPVGSVADAQRAGRRRTRRRHH